MYYLDEDGMSDIVQLDMDQYRLLIALQYLNASEDICKGLQRQRGVNDFQALRRNLAERAIDGVFSDRGFSIDWAV